MKCSFPLIAGSDPRTTYQLASITGTSGGSGEKTIMQPCYANENILEIELHCRTWFCQRVGVDTKDTGICFLIFKRF